MKAQVRQTESTIEFRDEERQRCEVWTRVMGYHRPVASFNIGKKGEHRERRLFQESRARGNYQIAEDCSISEEIVIPAKAGIQQ
jgi:hypothetical protein